jgi:hypothetical protein
MRLVPRHGGAAKEGWVVHRKPILQGDIEGFH